jgi:hypothetical protein
MKFNYKNYLPHFAAILVFAIATLIYFKPLMSGKELRQDDIARHKGMSKEIADYREKTGSEPLWTNSMFGGMPAYQISTKYPGNWLSGLDNLFKLFLPIPGGYLFLYCLGFFILLLCFEINPWLALVGGLAYGLSSYFLIIIEAGHNSKANALGYLPALIGGIVLLFRGKHWLGLAVTALFTAMELNANHLQITYYGYMLIFFIAVGYFFIRLKEKQLPSYFKGVAFAILATVIGLLPNAGNLMTTNEYGKFSTRGKTELTIKSNVKKNVGLDDQKQEENLVATEPKKQEYERNTTTGLDQDYATQWSYGIGETFTFLIPDFKGGASNIIRNADPNALKKVNPEFREQVGVSSSYFGDQPFTSGPVYIGAIIVFLAILGMFVIKNRIKWALFFGTLLTVALGWGKNFIGLTDFFMHNIPGYDKFRAVSMIMIVAELTLPLLAIMCINELLKLKSWDEKIKVAFIKKEMSVKRITLITAAITGGFCLLCYIMPDMFNTFIATNEEARLINRYVVAGNPEDQVRQAITEMMPHLEIARKAIFKSDAMRSFIFILLGFGALYLYFTGKINRNLLIGSLGLFVVVDLWTVDTRYLNASSFVTKEQNLQSLAEKTKADEIILQDPDPDYRVLDLSPDRWNDGMTSYYHKSIGGYHGAKLKKYQELIDFHLDQEIEYFYKHASKVFNNDSARNALLADLDVINMLNAKYFILQTGENGEEMPLENPQANGHAWFVKNLFVVPTADDEILGLRKINTKTHAITTEKYKSVTNIKDTYEGEGTIKLLSYKPNELVYETDTKEEEFAVFSEIYYPKGWNAYIDGQLKPHIEVNYILRGMPVPAGKHKIEFKFEPESYRTGNTLAMIGSILVLITVGAGLYLHRKGLAKASA